MKKKIFSLLLITIMLMALIPMTKSALAAATTHIASDGDTIYLDDSEYAPGDIIKVEAYAHVIIFGSKNVRIECEEGDAHVTAAGDVGGGAGIGGGYHGNGGTINIHGDAVCAVRGGGTSSDIGKGAGGSPGTINISGSAAVFLKRDSISPEPTTTAHKHITVTEDTDEIAGIPVPEGWTPTFGAYLIASILTYNANGGNDAPNQVIVAPGESVTVSDDTGMSFTGYEFATEFVRWDTQSDGHGISYDPGDSILMDVDKTLYAIWKEIKVENVDITNDTEVLLPYNEKTLTAVVSPDAALDKSLSWTSSDDSVATVDSQGVVTAVGMGTATIKAETSNGCFDTCQIVVSDVLMKYRLSTGSVMKMSADVLPSGTTIVWASDNESVATVEQDGTVTAKAPGFAIITATGGSVSQSCGIVVYDQEVTRVALNRTSADLIVNDTIELTAYVHPDDAVNKDVTWSSDNEDVATVNDSGTVTAVGKGTAKITAKSGEPSAECEVEVTLPVASVSIGSSSKKLSLNETADLTATVSPNGATDADITWTSNDTDIVTVDANGKVTAKGFGSTTVTAEAGGKYDTCTVSVVKTEVTGVTLSSTAETLKKGATVSLSATVKPTEATYSDVTWTSSDTDIVTVNQSGKVTAKDFGSATITAEADGVTAICTVAVVKTDVTGVTLSSTAETLKKGATVSLSATVKPTGATYSDVTWTSSDTDIVTVNQSGKVTAKDFGTATITAEADGVTAVCTVEVVKTDVAGVRLSSTSETLKKGATVSLSAEVSPGGATYPDAIWTSSDTDIVTVDASGKVTAISDGAAVIIADADGMYAVCAVLVSSDDNDGSDNDNVDNGDKEDNAQPSPTLQIEKVVITIVVSELPEGTASIKLPSGEVVELDGSDTIQVEVDEEDVSEDGSVEIVPCDDEGESLGTYAAEVKRIVVSDAVITQDTTWPVLTWVLVGIAGVCAAGLAVYLILRRKTE